MIGAGVFARRVGSLGGKARYIALAAAARLAFGLTIAFDQYLVDAMTARGRSRRSKRRANRRSGKCRPPRT